MPLIVASHVSAAAMPLVGPSVGRYTAARVADDAFPDDGELLRRLRAGDEAAFRGVVRRYHDTLRQLARAIVSSDALADEAIQETWLAVVRGLDSFEGRSALRTWVCRILVNRARTLAARDRRSVPMSALGDEADADAIDADRFAAGGGWQRPPAPWGDEDPASLVQRRELVALVGEAMAQLPERQRAVLLLRDVQGWDAADVCAVLELSEANQRVLLHRARAQVRDALERHLTPRSQP